MATYSTKCFSFQLLLHMVNRRNPFTSSTILLTYLDKAVLTFPHAFSSGMATLDISYSTLLSGLQQMVNKSVRWCCRLINVHFSCTAPVTKACNPLVILLFLTTTKERNKITDFKCSEVKLLLTFIQRSHKRQRQASKCLPFLHILVHLMHLTIIHKSQVNIFTACYLLITMTLLDFSIHSSSPTIISIWGGGGTWDKQQNRSPIQRHLLQVGRRRNHRRRHRLPWH